MSVLDKAAFDSAWDDPANNFKDAKPITAANLRAFATDISDSFVFSVSTVRCHLTISTADLLTGNSVPIVLVAAPGVGNLIAIKAPIIIKYIYGSAAFATHTSFDIFQGAVSVATIISVLNQTVNTIYNIGALSTTNNTATNVENQPLTLKISGGNPTAGTGSTLVIDFIYELNTL